MGKGQRLNETAAPPIPLTVLILWIFGGTAFAFIVYLFTPFTHNLDDIKVAFQYSLAPIVWGFFAVALWCGHIQRLHPAVVFSLSAFMLVMLLATLVGLFPWRAWHQLGYQLTIMAPFLVIAGTATNERRFRNMCLFYFLIGGGTIVLGLFHYFGGVGYIFQKVYPTGLPPQGYGPLYTLLYTLRLNGDMLSTILNRDFYSAYLIMVVPIGVALALSAPDLRAKIFFLLMFFLGCVCIILAFSKDSYIALFMILVIFLILFALRHDWRSVPKPLWGVWIAGGLVVFITAVWVVRDRLTNLEWAVNCSIVSRKIIWGGSWQVFCDLTRPLGTLLKFLLVGGGPGAFYLRFPFYRHPDYNLYQISHITIFSHNQYLDLTAEEGLLGFIAFMFFLGAVTWLLLREAWRKTQSPLNSYLIVLFSSVVGVSFQNIFSPGIRWTVCGFNYYFMMGLAVAGFHLTLTEQERARIDRFYSFSPTLRKTVAGAFLAFALVFEAVSVPYGVTYFLASKANNDGLILLNDFGIRCDEIGRPTSKQGEDPKFRADTRQLGLATMDRFRRALDWQPDFITAYYKLAHVYSRMATITDDPQESLEWWDKAKATYDELAGYAPDYSEIHLNYGILGRVFFGSTRKPEYLTMALRSFHKAARMCNRLVVQNYYAETLGIAASVAGTSSPLQAETVAALEQPLGDIALGPPPNDSHFSTVSAQAPTLHAARAVWNAQDSGRDSLERRLNELRELINAGRIQEAGNLEAELFRELGARVCERMPTLENQEGSEGEDYLRKARVATVDYYLPRGQYARILPALEALAKEDPRNVQWIKKWTAAAIQAGELQRCLDLLADAIVKDPLNWGAREAARKVLELREIENYEGSLKQTRALENIVAQMEKERPEIAAPQQGAALRQRLGGVPTMAEIVYQIGYASERTNRLSDALKSYTLTIEKDPNSEWATKAQSGISRIMPRIEAPSTSSTKPAKP